MMPTMGLPVDAAQYWNEFGDAAMLAWCAERTANADTNRAKAFYTSIGQLVDAIINADLPAVATYSSLAEGSGRITLNAVATVA